MNVVNQSGEKPAGPVNSRRHSGFTLIELLVVIATNDIACPRGSLNHLSARHNAGANLLDGHAANFK